MVDHIAEAQALRDGTTKNASNSLTQTQRKWWVSTSTRHQRSPNALHIMKQTRAQTFVATGIDCIATSLQAHHTSTFCLPARALCPALCAAFGHESQHAMLRLHIFYVVARPQLLAWRGTFSKRQSTCSWKLRSGFTVTLHPQTWTMRLWSLVLRVAFACSMYGQ